MSAELLTFAIAAGETKIFERQGRYIEVIEAAAPVSIFLSDTAGGRTDDLKNGLSGLFLEGAYARIEVFSAVDQVVTLLVMDGRGGSRRQPGTVRVIDQGQEKTIAGAQFFGQATQPGVAAKYSIAGLQAGTRQLVIRRLGLTSAAAGAKALFSATGAPTDTASNQDVINKLIGGPIAGARRVRGASVGTTPTLAELPGRASLTSVYVEANGVTEVLLTSPIILPPGAVLVAVGSSAVNTDVGFVFDAEEL